MVSQNPEKPEARSFIARAVAVNDIAAIGLVLALVVYLVFAAGYVAHTVHADYWYAVGWQGAVNRMHGDKSIPCCANRP